MRRCVLLMLVMLVLPAYGYSYGYGKADGGDGVAFNLQWDYYFSRGLDDVQLLDLDGDDIAEIYGCSYDSARPTMWVFDENGGLLHEIPIPRPGLVDFGNERVTMARPADFDRDGNLDILSASEIIASGMNSHRLYRFERAFQGDVKRYRMAMGWMQIRTGFVTGIALVGYDGRDGIYTSSSDFMIRSFDPTNGSLLWNISLGSSVWDIHPVSFGTNRTGFVAAAFKQLYVVNDSEAVVWNYPTDERFSRVYAGDVDNDSVDDIFAISGDVLYRFTIRGQMVWNKSIRETNTNIHSADFDNDGMGEIIVGSGQEVVGLNPMGEVAWRVDINEKPNYVTASNLSGLSLIVATSRGLKFFAVNQGVEANAENGSMMLEYAREQFTSGNRSSALAYAERAREAFLNLGSFDSTGECDRLLERIRTALSADQHYETALGYLEEGLHEEAINETEVAVGLYSKAGLPDGLNKSFSLNTSLHLLLYARGNMTLADYFYGEAESYYVKSDFESATEYARNASMYYRIAGDSAGVGKSEAIVRSALDRKTTTTTTTTQPAKKPEKLEYMDYLLKGSVALLLFIALAVLIYSKRKSA